MFGKENDDNVYHEIKGTYPDKVYLNPFYANFNLGLFLKRSLLHKLF